MKKNGMKDNRNLEILIKEKLVEKSMNFGAQNQMKKKKEKRKWNTYAVNP